MARVPVVKSILSGLLYSLVAVLSGVWVIVQAQAAEDAQILRLATTTSTENSGLLEELLPGFESRFDATVHVIAVGTGRALKMAEYGDIDVVMVHARQAEEAFLEAGWGTRREQFMYNDFVIVGPAEDPGGIRGLTDVREALRRLIDTESEFVSRGDDSGTHMRELQLWGIIGSRPAQQHYREAGQGMGRVLLMSSELQAYTLTDRGTWLKMRDDLDLQLLFEADPRLFNYYGVIPVNPGRHPHVNNELAEQFADWLISADAQARIDRYQLEGQRAFIPTRLSQPE